MISLDEYKELKSKVERLQARASKAEGAHEASMLRLKELGYDTIKEAETGLEGLSEKQEQAIADYEDSLSKFKEKWGSVLEEV